MLSGYDDLSGTVNHSHRNRPARRMRGNSTSHDGNLRIFTKKHCQHGSTAILRDICHAFSAINDHSKARLRSQNTRTYQRCILTKTVPHEKTGMQRVLLRHQSPT